MRTHTLFNLYDNFSRRDLDRMVFYDFHMNELGPDVPLISRPYAGRTVQSGEN